MWFIIHWLWLDIAYLYTKFDNFSFIRFKDMIEGSKKLEGPRDLITPFSGMICHPWARTCHHQPAYQI